MDWPSLFPGEDCEDHSTQGFHSFLLCSLPYSNQNISPPHESAQSRTLSLMGALETALRSPCSNSTPCIRNFRTFSKTPTCLDPDLWTTPQNFQLQAMDPRWHPFSGLLQRNWKN